MRLKMILPIIALASCSSPKDLLKEARQQAIADTETQYDMVEKSGSAIDKCVRAKMVSEAHLQAQDDDGYRRWKAIENLNCVNAGVPN